VRAAVLDEFCSVPTAREVGGPQCPDDGVALPHVPGRSTGRTAWPRTSYPAMLADVAAGRLDPSRLVERVVGLDEVPAALAALGAGTAGAGSTVVVP